MWEEILEQIYGKCEKNKVSIYHCMESVNGDIINQISLYWDDIALEQYFEYCKNNEYEIDYINGELERYKILLKVDEKHPEPLKTFVEQVNQLKSMKAHLNLLDYFSMDKYKVSEEKIEFPDSDFISIHVLFMQNIDFIRFFINSRLKAEEYCGNIIKYGNLLGEFDDCNLLGYVYERLTGVNLALLFGNYYIKMIQYFSYREVLAGSFCLDYDPIINEEWFEGKMSDCKINLKKKLIRLLGETIKLPIIFGRILQTDIILQSICRTVENFIDTYLLPEKNVICGMSNEKIANFLFSILDKVISEACRMDECGCFRFINDSYSNLKEICQKFIEDKEDIYKLWEEIRIGNYNTAGYWLSEKVKIITDNDKKSMIAKKDLNLFIKDHLRNNPSAKMPIVFIDDSIVEQKEYVGDLKEFFDNALKETK